MFLKKKAAITACSNGFPASRRIQVESLVRFLGETGIETVVSTCLYQRNETPFGGSPRERAWQLMSFYKNPEVGIIFDISGGDAANGILPYLDFDLIRESWTVFWGYSDLTTILICHLLRDRTAQIGHRKDSHGVLIGASVSLKS